MKQRCRPSITSSVVLAGMLACTAFADASQLPDAGVASASPSPMEGTWSCTTTQANAAPFSETDTIETIGSKDGSWLHGTARPDSPSAKTPYYDYYLTYNKTQSKWFYVEIDPTGYFVGTSSARVLDRSKWQVVYPTTGDYYTIAELEDVSSKRFEISRRNLIEVCTKQPGPGVPAHPKPTINCSTTSNDPASPAAYPGVEALSITGLSKNWWQGVATDPTSGDVVYEYNLLAIPPQWVAIVVNATTESFTISMSKIPDTKDLNNTVWVNVYPTVQSGFTFQDVMYDGKLPKSFQIEFRDGFQNCNPAQI